MHQARLLLGLLADGEGHDGRRLAASLGLDQAELRTQVQWLVGLGVPFADTGASLRLARGLDLLDTARLRSHIAPDALALLAGTEVLLDVDSTNRHLMTRAAAGLAGVHACVAERQSAGRGRRGKAWISPFGASPQPA